MTKRQKRVVMMCSHDLVNKRKARLKHDGHTCATCTNDNRSELRAYIKQCILEKEASFPRHDVKMDLVTLCNDCHEAIVSAHQKNASHPDTCVL